MANRDAPYLDRKPGDLITSEDWNALQVKIKEDIGAQVQSGIDGIEIVDRCQDAEKLAGKSLTEISDEIVKRALAEIPSRTGYKTIFKRLNVGEEKVIEHGLKACPLTDVYQLDYFEVVCAQDEDKFKQFVNFYLYHSSEKKIRFTDPATNTVTPVEIESTESQPSKIPLKEMLERYHVPYTETSSLADLETEFWKALFAEPNDEFDHNQYCHSPWFERCCQEKRTVKSLRQKGDWDDLWFQMRPRKTNNFKLDVPSAAGLDTSAPTQIEVVQFDFDTLGIKLLDNPVYPAGLTGITTTELKVMLLLKV